MALAFESAKPRSPALWVPSLYLAEAIPYAVVNGVSLQMYKSLGLGDAEITAITSLIAWPWSFKPLFSPFMEMFKTKKYFVLLTQIVGGLLCAGVALSLTSNSFVRYSFAFLALAAIGGSTHDIAADGVYIESLSTDQQAKYAGWQSAAWQTGRIVASGALVKVADVFERRFGPRSAWMIVMAIYAAILFALAAYHARALPPGRPAQRVASGRAAVREFIHVAAVFFRKRHVFWGIAFVILYRFAEGQAQRVFQLFLRADRAHGGLGLSTGDVGIAYGGAGTLALLFGSLAGGYYVAGRDLRKALIPLCAMYNVPYLAYLSLVWLRPQSLLVTTAGIVIELFGMGFGFVGVLLFMMQQMASGPYKMAHYAFATAAMNLGLVLPGLWSGELSDRIGYLAFFVWVMASTIVSFVVSWRVPFKTQAEIAAENAQEAAAAT